MINESSVCLGDGYRLATSVDIGRSDVEFGLSKGEWTNPQRLVTIQPSKIIEGAKFWSDDYVYACARVPILPHEEDTPASQLTRLGEKRVKVNYRGEMKPMEPPKWYTEATEEERESMNIDLRVGRPPTPVVSINELTADRDMTMEEATFFQSQIERGKPDKMTKVQVYLDNAVVYEYQTDNPMKAREHASEIIKNGYRTNEENDLVWYPPHRILKIKVQNGKDGTNYDDVKRAT